MRLRPEQLEAHLAGQLLPIYVLVGDEPLQMAEAADAVRAAARVRGFGERELMHAEAGFDWNTLLAAMGAMSLFAERRILDLRLPTGKPGDAGGKALTAYAGDPPPDDLLLISCGKLDKKSQSTKWFKALEAAGAVLQVWPLEPAALPGWVARRMRSRGLQPNDAAARLLAERVEGNLLAAAQEVDKLLLLRGPGPVDEAAVEQAVADSARFDVFELADTALAGDAVRTARVIAGLRGEGVEPVLVLWALAREIRALAQMAAEVEAGSRPDAVLSAHRVWQKRKGPVSAGLKRHNAVRWRRLLRRAARLDRVVKGAERGDAWDELLQLALLMAGVRLRTAV